VEFSDHSGNNVERQKTYTEFLEMEEGIATNILADRLKRLQVEGIITKARDPYNRRSYIYSLTGKGLDLAPIVLEIVSWSGKYHDRPFAVKTVFNKIKKDRRGFEAQTRDSHA